MIAAAVLGELSCGYRLAGGNRLLPAHVHSIAIPPFQNITSRSEIEQRITEQLLEEFIRRGRFHTQADPAGADAVVEGVVTSFSTQPIQFTAQGKATKFEVTIQARVAMTDLTTQTVLWSQDHFIFRGQYDVPESGRAFFDREILALDQIARDFARTIVTSILEGF